MYADDTSLTVAHFDEYTLEKLMNHDFREIHSWLITNKLKPKCDKDQIHNCS